MIREGIEKIQELVEFGSAEVLRLGEREYLKTAKGLSRIETPVPETIKASTLKAVVEYSAICGGRYAGADLLVHVAAPGLVRVLSAELAPWQARAVLMESTAITESFRFGEFMDLERFIIDVQATFVMDENAKEVIRIASGVSAKAQMRVADDGVSQAVTVKRGITTMAEERVPNPVILRPYRTFVEIEQPASEYVFRLRADGETIKAALISANGGRWKVQAIAEISACLSLALESAGTGNATVIA